MNNEIQSLEFEGNKVRTAQDENGNPLFCGTDVAQVLGYANPAKAVINHCKGFPIRKPLETAGGIQQVRFISEGDLYRLITSSKLPAAERFEKWVYDEVLPSIRRHGGYMAGQERMTPEQMALASLKWLQSKVDEQAKQLKSPGRQGPVRQRGRNREDVHPCGRFREDPEKQRHRHRPTAPVRLAPRAWMAHQGQGLQLEHAHAEGDGPSPVRDQGDDHQPLGRAHHDQQDAEDDRQGTDVFRQTVPLETDAGSGCVMPIDNSLVPCRADKPNPFEALFALIYMGVGAVCLIAGLRRMERWEILFGFAMLMVASQASNRFLARKRLYEDCLVFCKPSEVTREAEGKMPRTRQADGHPRKEALK